MKKLLASLFATVLIAGSASAATYWDENPADTWLVLINPTYTGTFDLTGVGPGKGFNPATEIITDAFASFKFYDLVGPEEFSVSFDTQFFGSGSSFFGEFVIDGDVVGSALISLQQNGILSYTAQIDEWWASVLLVEARLDVSTRQVPDSASVVALLGASLVGMSLLRRKR